MAKVLLWVARISGIAAIIPLLMIAVGEFGHGPSGLREWIYLVLFPFGFAIGYLIGWRWPLLGGCLSLICIVLSLIVIGRTFDLGAYLIWAFLSLPGILFVISGLMVRRQIGDPRTDTNQVLLN